MDDRDREQFSGMIRAAIGTYKQVDARASGYWFECLKGYDLQTIRVALIEFGKNATRAPTPNAIIDLIRAKKPQDATCTLATAWHWNDLMCCARMIQILGYEKARLSYDEGLARIAATAMEGSGSGQDAVREFLRINGGACWNMPRDP